MAVAVIMPRQGQSVESCILTEWYKNIGDSVSEGDLLFAYETDKASFEEEAQSDGILLARFFEAGDEVPVLLNVAVLGAEGDEIESFKPEGVSAEAPAGVPSSDEAPGVSPTSDQTEILSASQQEITISDAGGNGTGAISPRAKRLAKEKRVLVDGIAGSGPEGRIIERDILEEIKNGKTLNTPCSEESRRRGINCT